MASSTDLIAAANESFIGSYRKLSEHTGGAVVQFGGVFAFSTGLPHPLFNGCVVVEPGTAAEVDAAISWVAARDEPYRVWIDEGRAADLEAAVLAHGLVRDEEPYPAMVLHPTREPPRPAPGVSVARVSDPAGLEEHLGVHIAGGTPPDVARRLISHTMAGDPDVNLFTGYLDGRPAGVSLAMRTGAVGGVYAVGTLAEARRRGVGVAVTWACVSAAAQWGLDTVALQSSEMGFSLYRAMGFRVVTSYAVYQHRPTGDGG